MTKLAEDFADLTEERHISRCGVKKLLDSLDEADRKALTDALAAEDITTRRLHEWLNKHGHRVDYYALLRHRKVNGTGCRCPKGDI